MGTRTRAQLAMSIWTAGLFLAAVIEAAEPSPPMVSPAVHETLILPNDGSIGTDGMIVLPAAYSSTAAAGPRGVLPAFSHVDGKALCTTCGQSGHCGDGPCPVYYPPRPRGCKHKKRRMMLENRLCEPGWYRYYRAEHYGYYPTQWRAWPEGFDACRRPLPSSHARSQSRSLGTPSPQIERAPDSVPSGTFLKPVPKSSPVPPPRNSRSQ